MYRLKRTSKTPGSAIKIAVDQPDGQDAGFGQGGTFYFMPAGEDGDTHEVSELAARAIMEDPDMAQHFSCTPALPAKVAPVADAAPVADGQPDSTTAARRPRRTRGGAKVGD